MLGPDMDLDDVVQNVFLRVFKNLHTINEPRKLENWIMRVTTYTVHQELRYRRVRWLRYRRASELDELVDASAPTAEELDRARCVHAALRRLPKREHLVLMLSEFEGCTRGEIAEACGTSLATVGRVLTAARARFKRIVRRDPVLAHYLSKAGG